MIARDEASGRDATDPLGSFRARFALPEGAMGS
jgi:hypothetical protein